MQKITVCSCHFCFRSLHLQKVNKFSVPFCLIWRIFAVKKFFGASPMKASPHLWRKYDVDCLYIYRNCLSKNLLFFLPSSYKIIPERIIFSGWNSLFFIIIFFGILHGLISIHTLSAWRREWRRRRSKNEWKYNRNHGDAHKQFMLSKCNELTEQKCECFVN